MIEVKTWRDPYDAGFSPTEPTKITINPGLTVLTGCNGSGKTTLLQNIHQFCNNNNIPCHLYDNLRDGGNSSVLGALLSGYKEFDCDNMYFGASVFNSSEGEAIKAMIGRQSTLYKEFIKTGHYKNKDYKFKKIFNDVPDIIDDNRRILLFDASDSGVSIDSICEIKELFKNIIKDAEEKCIEMYIIISANEYELCRGEKCFNVNSGKYLTFKDYEDYRDYILKSRERKEKRIKQQELWYKKQKEKEIKKYVKLKEKTKEAIKKYNDECHKQGISPQSFKLDGLKRNFEDFVRHSKYNDFDDTL